MPPRTTSTPPQHAPGQVAGDLLLAGAHVTRAYNVELAIIAAIIVASFAGPAGWIVAAVATLILFAVPAVRGHATRTLDNRRARREWNRATRHLELRNTIRRVEPVPAGHQLTITTRDRQPIEAAQDTLASILRARELTVDRDPRNASQLTVTIRRHDPFEDLADIPWPCHDATTLSLWDPIPIGVDENGRPVTITLAYRNLLIGGLQDSGKSVAQAIIIAAAALDPNTRLYLADGKELDSDHWEPVCHQKVGRNRKEFCRMLRELQETMNHQIDLLRAQQARKVTRTTGVPHHLLIIDELAVYLNAPDQTGKKDANEAFDRLRDLISRGRAVGIIIIAATQRASHEIIPTDLRDLFQYRLGLRAMTNDTSDMILGQGWATEGWTTKGIPDDQPGTGLLLTNGRTPTRIRGFMMNDATERRIAQHASTRQQHANT